MGLAIDIVKRDGLRPTEQFETEKLRKSILAACLSVRSPEGHAEKTANAVCDTVLDWLKERSEVTSKDLRRIASKHLKNYHPEAAYLYEQHRIII